LISIIAGSVRWASSVGLPASSPSSVRFSPADGGIILTYDGQESDVVTTERLGALLISYSVRAHIPLPELAAKSVRIGANSVVLACTSHYSEVPEAR
jgi:hypothetical protein